MKSHRRVGTGLLFLMMAVLGFASRTQADDSAMMGKIGQLEKTLTQLQQTIEAQNQKIANLEQKVSVDIKGPGAAEAGSARPGDFKQQFDSRLKEKIGDSDAWLKDLKFTGDLRLRYDGQSQTSGATSGGLSAERNFNRFRFRLRFGFEKKLMPDMIVGFSLASGSVGAITSANQTMNSDFGMKTIQIEKAFATYLPKWAKVGPIQSFEVTLGKFKNPFEEGSTLMIWDRDVRPEGVYEKVESKLIDVEKIAVNGVLTAGQLILNESRSTGNGRSRDAELYALQGGFKSKINGVTEKPIEMKNLVSFYNFDKITSPGNFISSTTVGNYTDNGGLSAQRFREVEFYNELAVQVKGLPVIKPYLDWSVNTGENAQVDLGSGQDTAWSMGAKVGDAQKKGAWEALYEYYWIEAGSTPGVFSDSDFGGVNRRGSVIRAGYGLTDNLMLNTSFYFSNWIQKNATFQDAETRLFQVDLVWKL